MSDTCQTRVRRNSCARGFPGGGGGGGCWLTLLLGRVAIGDEKLLAGLKSKGARPGQEAVKQAEEQSRTELFEEIARMSDRLASAAKAKDLAACQQAFWQLSQKISSLPGSS